MSHHLAEPSIATRFAAWLVVAMLISVGIVYGTFWFFEGQELSAGRASQIATAAGPISR